MSHHRGRTLTPMFFRWDTELKRLQKDVERGAVDPQVLAEANNQRAKWAMLRDTFSPQAPAPSNFADASIGADQPAQAGRTSARRRFGKSPEISGMMGGMGGGAMKKQRRIPARERGGTRSERQSGLVRTGWRQSR